MYSARHGPVIFGRSPTNIVQLEVKTPNRSMGRFSTHSERANTWNVLLISKLGNRKTLITVERARYISLFSYAAIAMCEAYLVL